MQKARMKKRGMIMSKIDVSHIYLQKSIPNRDRQQIEFSMDFVKLLNSIEKTDGGLLHPVIVREDSNGKYELFSGHRRFIVYSNLSSSEEGRVKYSRILAEIWPKETSTKKMLAMSIHENKVRADPSSLESLEAQIASLPFYLGCGVEGEHERNKQKGYKILRQYNSIMRSKNIKKVKLLVEMTGCDDPISGLTEFFKGMTENVRTFYDKARVLLDSSPEVLHLLRTKRISMRHARALNAMKSSSERATLIRRAMSERIAYKDFDELILEAKQRINPSKKRDALVKFSKSIFVMMQNQKKDLTEEQSNTINSYLQRIEQILMEES